MTIKIISLNVNGIRDHKKRTTVFYWLKQQKADICLLQETHCESQTDIVSWSNEWEGKTFWSIGTNYSKGVAILIKEKLDITITNTEIDTDGRYVAINIDIDELRSKVMNIYAPNKPADRINFFKELKKNILEYQSIDTNDNELIIGGDFNCALETNLDRRSAANDVTQKSDQGSKQLLELIREAELEDVWRRRHPTVKRYTYFKANSKTASRIDNWLISKSLDSSIISSCIVQAVRSDHASIQLLVKTNKEERGPGTWKMNNQVLNSDSFINTFTAFWQGWKKETVNFKSLKEWWEMTKVHIKNISIQISKQLSKNYYIQESKLHNELQTLKNSDHPNLNQISSIENRLTEHWDRKAQGARIRAKVEYYEKGERSTKYFYNLEKIHARNKLWYQIKDNDGKIKHGIENVMEEQVKFYSNLLKSEGWDKNAADKLIQNVSKTLNESDHKMCESQISKKEVSDAISLLKIDKSPGEDGITAEFYKKFWHVIKKEFLEVAKVIEESKTLCESQCRGIISLLYKKGDRDDIKNWRPITLLNIDYKIIAKVYAERLKKVLPSIIHPDQKAFLAGRQITESVRLIQDVIDFTDYDDKEGAIIFLDQQKAFDRVEWGYLDLCLKKYGFGQNFRGSIAMLYKNGKSCINTNGFLSKFFPISRSMRQGCPIAAYLYILQAEPMAQTIRNDDKISGITIPGENNAKLDVKIALFADDTQFFHNSEASIKRGFTILELYCQASGAKINLSKTKGLYIGSWKNKEPEFKKFAWVSSANALGAEYGYNIDYNEIWMKKFTKFKNKISQWQKRDLSLKGKKLLINSYIMSSVSYLTDIYTEHVPPIFLKETKNLIKEFLWGGKTWRVASKTMATRSQHGGLEIPDLESYIKSKKISWILKIHYKPSSTWNTIGKYYLTLYDEKFDTQNFLLKCSHKKSLNLDKIPHFYKICLEAWSEMLSKVHAGSKDDILNANLMGNCKILCKNTPLFLCHWTKSKIKRVKDIWNDDTNSWKSGQEIFNQLYKRTNWIAEYEKIKKAIPNEWKNVLQGQKIEILKSKELLYNTKSITLNDSTIKVDEKNLTIEDLKFKEIYFDTLYPVKKPTCIPSWEARFSKEIDLKQTVKRSSYSIQGNKQDDFHWKVFHRAVYSEMRLNRMGKSNGVCRICNTHNEDLCHLVYFCQKINQVWEKIEQKLENILDTIITLDIETVILGSNSNETDIPKTHHYIANLFIFETKWQLWKNRNCVKYGNKATLNVEELYYKICDACKQQYSLLQATNKQSLIKKLDPFLKDLSV